ncbi:MAG: hypothetical protein CM1200mP20_10220 [Pseudomonadota bacterium]|nr:MAG: hypothetical protein CM1200mP20_10220 [Pseudomonadota bacterium]
MIFIAAALALVYFGDVSLRIWFSVVVGALGGIVIGLITEYYTAGNPCRRLQNPVRPVRPPS